MLLGVSYSYHDDFHACNIGRAEYSHFSTFVILIVRYGGADCQIVGTDTGISVLFHLYELFEVYVQFIVRRPYCFTIACSDVPWGEGQRHFIFIIVIREVCSKPYEQRKVAFLVIVELVHFLGMDKHLQAFVLSHVEIGCLIYGSCISVSEFPNFQTLSLFVHVRYGGCTNQFFLLYSGRNNVWNRTSHSVFLIVHRSNGKGGILALSSARINSGGKKIVCIFSPLSAYEFKGSESQNDRFLKVS